MEKPEKTKKDKKAVMLGLGLDNKDGHTRVTKGENFCLLGGSEETHDRMTETAMPHAAVLAYNEIVSDVQVEAVGIVGLNG